MGTGTLTALLCKPDFDVRLACVTVGRFFLWVWQLTSARKKSSKILFEKELVCFTILTLETFFHVAS